MDAELISRSVYRAIITSWIAFVRAAAEIESDTADSHQLTQKRQIKRGPCVELPCNSSIGSWLMTVLVTRNRRILLN